MLWVKWERSYVSKDSLCSHPLYHVCPVPTINSENHANSQGGYFCTAILKEGCTSCRHRPHFLVYTLQAKARYLIFEALGSIHTTHTRSQFNCSYGDNEKFQNLILSCKI